MPTLTKNGHTVTTSIPAEAVQLRAQGYKDVATPKPDAPAPAPKPSK